MTVVSRTTDEFSLKSSCSLSCYRLGVVLSFRLKQMPPRELNAQNIKGMNSR